MLKLTVAVITLNIVLIVMRPTPAHSTHPQTMQTAPIAAQPSTPATPTPQPEPTRTDEQVLVATQPGALPEAPAGQPWAERLPDRYVTIHQLRATATSVGWPVAALDPLTRVALCESGLALNGHGYKDAIDVEAASTTNDLGAMQVNRIHATSGGIIGRMGYRWEQMSVLVPNLRVALAIYEQRGWDAWSCKP